MEKPSLESASLFAGVLSALGASVCCTLPFALVSFGVAGAWMSQLRTLERFFPVFIVLALGAFAYGFYLLYLRPVERGPEEECAVRRRQRIAFWITLAIAAMVVALPFVVAK